MRENKIVCGRVVCDKLVKKLCVCMTKLCGKELHQCVRACA